MAGGTALSRGAARRASSMPRRKRRRSSQMGSSPRKYSCAATLLSVGGARHRLQAGSSPGWGSSAQKTPPPHSPSEIRSESRGAVQAPAIPPASPPAAALETTPMGERRLVPRPPAARSGRRYPRLSRRCRDWQGRKLRSVQQATAPGWPWRAVRRSGRVWRAIG